MNILLERGSMNGLAVSLPSRCRALLIHVYVVRESAVGKHA